MELFNLPVERLFLKLIAANKNLYLGFRVILELKIEILKFVICFLVFTKSLPPRLKRLNKFFRTIFFLPSLTSFFKVQMAKKRRAQKTKLL